MNLFFLFSLSLWAQTEVATDISSKIAKVQSQLSKRLLETSSSSKVLEIQKLIKTISDLHQDCQVQLKAADAPLTACLQLKTYAEFSPQVQMLHLKRTKDLEIQNYRKQRHSD